MYGRIQWPLSLRRSLDGIMVSNSAGDMDVRFFLVLCVVRYRTLRRVAPSSTEFGVSEFDRKAAIMRRPWSTRAVAPGGMGRARSQCLGITICMSM